MFKLAVLGATGPTGLEVVRQALERGHLVTAIVRSVEKLKHITHDNLKVEKADVFDSDSLVPHLSGKDAVLSCLGYTEGMPKAPITFYTDTMKSVSMAMKQAEISRLICITTMCTKSNPGQPFIIEWIVKPFFLKYICMNMAEMEDYLHDFKDINYTVVKPAQLTNDADTGEPVKAAQGEFVPYTVWEACSGKPFMISRAKLVRFMLDCLNSSEYDRTLVSVY